MANENPDGPDTNETWVVIPETCRICGKNLRIVCTEHAADCGYAEGLIEPLCDDHRRRDIRGPVVRDADR